MEEKMRSLYSRIQRASIYHPATIGDIPQEVLRKAFIYLMPGESDLVAPSESCRAWRPVAQELMYSRQRFDEESGIDRFICGFHLQSLVFGLGSVSINRLEIEFVRKEEIHLLTRLASPSLSSIDLDFLSSDGILRKSPSDCYATLEIVFLQCRQIRSISLRGCDFGEDPDVISPSIKEGFSRLTRLDIDRCSGDIPMFFNQTPITNLRTIACYSDDENIDYAVVNAIASNYRTLIR
jgi:hypothetical protein